MGRSKLKQIAKNLTIYIVIFALVLVAANFYKNVPKEETKEIKFSELVQQLEKKNVKEAAAKSSSNEERN